MVFPGLLGLVVVTGKHITNDIVLSIHGAQCRSFPYITENLLHSLCNQCVFLTHRGKKKLDAALL